MTDRPLVYDLTFERLQEHLAALGEPAYRARQVWDWLYSHLVERPQEMTSLPFELREKLDADFTFSSISSQRAFHSADGETQKLLLELRDGQRIEAVLMRYENRRTACISTQAGCGMGCVFCATGQMGFLRNLTSGEIIEQVLLFSRKLMARGERLTNVVVMGMGEPLHNYEATVEAIRRLNDSNGFNFGARRITVSTVGLVPMIDRFAQEEPQVNLAVSLHAATDALRTELLPINRRYPLPRLMDACRRYAKSTGRRITFEWALIRGVNDGLDQAQALAGLVEGMLCHVNLIPLNPTRGYAGDATPEERAAAFRDHLIGRGVPCTIRVRRGIDIQAGCGQLATEGGR